ncbi:MAG: hydantoinase B/oxoprolinase family protein [Alphaproteobacteria bacterium]|nr:hydantoinase B/oxoprolinase family protein [Alphaproteobacteria bacterium]
MKTDPVLLEILSNKAIATAEEMGYALQRTGRTLYVKETADFGTALVKPDGKFFAYPAAIGVSGFIDLDCGPSIRAVKDLAPGDVIITNHPYASEGLATHTPDLHLIQPYFHGGRIVCYGWSFIHISDVGGAVPSSISPRSREVYQEGFLIPPMKLRRGGELNPDFLTLFLANCRTPETNLGDIRAMLAALEVGRRRVDEMIRQHGLDVFLQAQEDIVAYTARRARDALRRLADGRYEFWDYLDDDLATGIPLRVRVAVTIRGGEAEVDYTGTDPQVMAAYNIPTGGKRHPWLTLKLVHFVCTMDRGIPLNEGLFQPVHVIAPSGSIVNPEFPAATGVRHAAAIRVNDALNGALAKAAPDLVPACNGGVTIPVVLAEATGATGQRNVIVIEPMIGGMGARKGHDGVDGRDSSISNLANNPLETVEADAAIEVIDYAVRPDSGGAGQWRGGNGLVLTFRVLSDGASVLGRGMERFRFQPYGVAGGMPGASARTVLSMGGPDERELGKIDMLDLKAGDVVTVMTPGGGGWGDPLERDPEAVLADVRRGFVSAEAAARDYGVVVRAGRLDAAATAARRQAAPPRPAEAFSFGPERAAWERVFDDRRAVALNAALEPLPVAQRQHERRRAILAVVPELADDPKAILANALRDAAARGRRLDAELARLGAGRVGRAAE